MKKVSRFIKLVLCLETLFSAGCTHFQKPIYSDPSEKADASETQDSSPIPSGDAEQPASFSAALAEPAPTAYTDSETGIIYSSVDESAVSPTYIRYTEQETEVQRFPDQIKAEFVTYEQDYSWFTFTDTDTGKSITVGILGLLPDLELRITGQKEGTGDRYYIELNFNREIESPLNEAGSRYGLFWFNWNYAAIDGVSFQNYVVTNLPDQPGKGGKIISESNGWKVIFYDSYYETVMNSSEVSEQEKKELETLHSKEYVILSDEVKS